MADVMKRLRAAGIKLPEVTEGIACEGTKLERRTLKIRGKAFAFLGTNDLMIKRDGAWLKTELGPSAPPFATLERWLAQSYAAFASLKPKVIAKRKPTPKATATKGKARRRR